MPQPKVSTQEDTTTPKTVALSVEQRIELLANLIVERIMEDQRAGGQLLKQVAGGTHAES